MNVTTLLVSSVVAAVVAGLFSFLTQSWLLERKARIDYKLPARQRLYEALGPLRLQFLFSARDLVHRVDRHPEKRWNMNPSDYYASSFIWRLLRPLAIGQLIERQMTVADFSVDPGSLELLRFTAAMHEMLTGGDVVMEHPKVNWATQSQHLFGDNLRVAAAKLFIDGDNGADRVMDFAQFAREFPDPSKEQELKALAAIFASCSRDGGSLLANSIFWLRVVGYTYVCHELLVTEGSKLGFEDHPLDVERLLATVPDEYISSRTAQYRSQLDSIISRSL